jgi:dihydroxyacetone kinase
MAARQLINDPKDVVEEMLDGLTASQPGLQKLDGYNVIVRKHIDKSKVAIISGGGSGHEPSHAGWVGPGMLTAAVAGPVFASPSSVSVLAAIMHVTGSGGCLVIVKNYTGDRLWFGLACEQAKAAGLQVELVVVGDDCALADRGLGIAGRRGVAGTVLVHKVAGAAAEAGRSLEDVAAAAREAAAAVGTMGVALSTCTLPGQARASRIADGMMEVGLGIHGESGAIVSPLAPVDSIVDTLLGYITSQEAGRGYLTVSKGARVAVLVNNLGGSTSMELSIAMRRALAALEGPSYGAVVERTLCGNLMTALDMVGLSVSVMVVTPAMVEALDAPCSAPAWPGAHPVNRQPNAAQPALPSGAGDSSPADVRPPAGAAPMDEAQSSAVAAAIKAAAAALQAGEAQLTAWDQICGDGDCGTTLSAGAAALVRDLGSARLEHPASISQAIACSLGRSMGGSSGALYCIFFNSFASAFGAQPATPAAVSAAFTAGCDAMSRYGGARTGHRTMLDALLPAAEAMAAAVPSGSMGGLLRAAADAAAKGAEATKTMVAGAGRATYVPAESLDQVPDPGAMAVAMWLEAVAKAAVGAKL